MTAIVLLGLCLGIGLLMARDARLPPAAPQALNFWIVNVALPALILVEVPKLSLSADLLFAAAGPWLVFVGSAALLGFAGRRLRWPRATTGALVLTCGLGNTAFMGVAMVEALAGPDHVGAAVIADQFGSFLALSIGGVVIAALYAGESASPAAIGRRIVGFTPFLALLAALLLWSLGGLPELLQTVLGRISLTLTPLALFSVGLQLRFSGLRARGPTLAIGLAWKLLAAPALILALAVATGLVRTPVATATMLQCAMPPMVTAGILAEQYRLDAELANLVIGVGTILSVVTLSAAAWLL